MRLALFDLDGTITRRDTLLDFIYYAVGPLRFCTGLCRLSPFLAAHVLGILPNDETKVIVLDCFFKGWEQEPFEKIAQDYSLTRLDKLVRESARQKLKWHCEQGHKVIIITASIEDYLEDWCAGLKAELIATRLEFKDGKYTGKLATPNCRGEEKVRRFKEIYDPADFEYIYAYGDAPSDHALKTIAHEFHFRTFK